MQHRQVLTLQHNYLTGSIPPGIVNGSQLCFLLLNDNRLRGHLPSLSPALFRPSCTIYSGKRFSSQFRPAVLVHNNRLSCTLRGKPNATDLSGYHGNNQCGNNSYPQCNGDFRFYPSGYCSEPVTVSAGIQIVSSFTNNLFLAGNRFSAKPEARPWTHTGREEIGTRSGHLPDWMVRVREERNN